MVPIRERKTYSVLLADDLTLVREGLAALCAAHAQYQVVGQCSEGATALRMIETQKPDLAVLDLNLPDLFTMEIVRRVRDANLPTKIVVLSVRKDRKTVVEALRCGVSGFLLKSAPSSELLEALEQVLEGSIYVSPQLELNKIFSTNHKNSPDDPLDLLSAREYQRDCSPAGIEPENHRYVPRQLDAQAGHPRRGRPGEIRHQSRSDLDLI
jgi:DNA-binding NarL/FixJ family response regulator